MTKEKLKSLKTYKALLESRLAGPVPAKHVGHPESFKQFLRNELATVTVKLEDAKLDGVK
jgi:hypothetical protein